MSPRQVDRRPAGGGRGGRGWRGWSAREGARHRKGGESAGTRWWGLGALKRKVRFSGTVRAIIIQKVIKYQNRPLYFHPIIIYIYIKTIVICEVFPFIMSGLELTCISSGGNAEHLAGAGNYLRHRWIGLAQVWWWEETSHQCHQLKTSCNNNYLVTVVTRD